MNQPSRTVIVVGAGVFGTASAIELRRRGWETTLLDPGPLPHPRASSTDISKIVRMDYGPDAFYSELARDALVGWDAWNGAWDVPLYHEDGFLILSGDGMAPGTFERESHDVLSEMGVKLDPVDPEVLRARFPAWADGRFRTGYFNPRAGWAESGRVVGKMLERARGLGVRLLTRRTFVRLVEDGSRVAGVRTKDGTDHPADRVVVAAGAWTPSLLPWLSDVMWATGQPVLHFRVDDPERWKAPAFPTWAADIAGTGWYGFPALDDGTLKIGHHGTGRRVDPDQLRIVDPDHEARCRDFLSEALPDLVDAPAVSSRLCLYCDTFDGDFWIGEDPEREGLVVAAGGSGHGFKFAPVLGPIVADAVEGRENPRLERFRWRPKGEPRTEAARSAE